MVLVPRREAGGVAAVHAYAVEAREHARGETVHTLVRRRELPPRSRVRVKVKVRVRVRVSP